MTRSSAHAAIVFACFLLPRAVRRKSRRTSWPQPFSALVNRLAGGALTRAPSEFVKVRMGPLTTLYWITRGGGEVVVRQVSMRLNSGAGGMGTLGADVDGRGGESADAGE